MVGAEPLTLADLVARPSWMADAACQEHPEVDFHPDRGESVEPAKAVCAECLCRAECLSYAIAEGIEHGIWGGTAPRARQALRGARTAA